MKRFLQVILLFAINYSATAQTINWAKSINLGVGSTHLVADMEESNLSDAKYIVGRSYELNLNTGVPFQTAPAYAYLCKVDAAGDTLWKWNNTTTATDGGSGMFPSSIAVDDNDNVYIAGFYSMSSLSYTMSIDTALMPTNPFYYGGFLAKFNSEGEVQWVRAVSAPVQYNDIDIDAFGNIYLLGNVQWSVTFGSTTIQTTSSSYYRDFIVSYDPSGSLLWAKGYGEIDFNNTFVSNTGALLKLVVDKGSTPYIYAAGFFLTPYNANGNTFTSSGAEDALILKLDQNGNYIHGLKVGAANTDAFYDIAMNANAEIVLGTTFRHSTTINGNTFSNPGYYKTVIIKMDTAFNYKFVNLCPLSSLPPSVDIDDHGRSVLAVGNSVGSTPYTFDYIQFYDSAGVLLFSKQATGSSSYLGLLQCSAVLISHQHDTLMYLGGQYKSELTVDTFNLICIEDFNAEIALIEYAIPAYIPDTIDTTDTTTAIYEHRLKSDAWIYPNPAIQRISISSQHDIGFIEVFDINGRMIFRKENDFNTVNVENLHAGVYNVRVTMKNGNFIYKRFLKTD